MSVEDEEWQAQLLAEGCELEQQEWEEDQAEDQEEASEGGLQEEAGTYNTEQVNDQVFEELQLRPDVAEEVQSVWRSLLSSGGSEEAVGEVIYAALFDAAPSLQSLFKTPRAVMAMRFANGLHQIITTLGEPKALKVCVETLAFQHMEFQVTVPRVIIFRDAICDLLQIEMGARFTPKARQGWETCLNYVGGACIYTRVKFSERIRILTSSWAVATKKDLTEDEEEEAEKGKCEAEKAIADGSGESTATTSDLTGGPGMLVKRSGEGGSGEDSQRIRNNAVPTTFATMFAFNQAVMGFKGRTWMSEVVSSLDAIVSNVSNTYRVQEECDVLSLRMAKCKGNINLGEYRSVMLATLRSLCKDWGSQHEVAWSWLWDNVERMLTRVMGKPAAQQRALAAFLSSLDGEALTLIRREVFRKFFALAPAGQDFFKQSTTRLHFITDKLIGITLDMYEAPKRMVEDLSALGLRHVGYGIPTDLFGPFVSACVQVVRSLTDSDAAEEAFRWSLSLISRVLVRVINEGSTIVMKAINANSAKLLHRAVACAPRGKRALWMLSVQVGMQSISPLMWAIEVGSLDAAKAIIIDLLTIRADRDQYYYGMDILFERHPDIIKRLCLDAASLLPTLLDGLIWRSRMTEDGLRRVNYYVKHLVVDEDGGFSKATEWLAEHADPKVVGHPIVALVTDMVWSHIALRTFLYGKMWFCFTLIVFVCSQSVLKRWETEQDGPSSSVASLTTSEYAGDSTFEIRLAVFTLRCFIYLCSMGPMTVHHVKCSLRDIRNQEVVRCGPLVIPGHFRTWQGSVGVLLTVLLALMLCTEPILHCFAHGNEQPFTEKCAESKHMVMPYSVASAGAMLLYFLLLADLSVLSTRVSAFTLTCGRILSEVSLFLFGLTFFVLAFASAVSCLEHSNQDFAGIPNAALQLYKITFNMFSGEQFSMLAESPMLLLAVFAYIITTVTLMLNLLIAQLICAYQASFRDMIGFARLNRGKIVTETMSVVPRWRWTRFVAALKLNERVEFGEGDLGLAGGIQVWEPSSANITTVDTIRRFGGTTSAKAQWPAEHAGANAEEDRFDRLEKIIAKAVKRMSRSHGGRHGSTVGSSSMGLSCSSDPTSSGDYRSDSGLSY